jgi:preprotein translocase subunit YajC
MNLWTMEFSMRDGGLPFLVAMGAPPAGGGVNPLVQFIPFALVLGIFYFIILRPMRQKQQKVEAFLSELKVGDQVVTSGGIYGSITRLSDQSVQLQIAERVRVEVSRAAIVGYQGQKPVAQESGS